MSILPPHPAAAALPDVDFWAYAAHAATSELLLEIDVIMLSTEVAAPAALGGLMIPNMPF